MNPAKFSPRTSIEQLRKVYKEKAESALSVAKAKPVLTSEEIEQLVERRANELIDARLREIEQERAKADELMSKLLEDKEVRRLLVRKIRELGLAEKVR